MNKRKEKTEKVESKGKRVTVVSSPMAESNLLHIKRRRKTPDVVRCMNGSSSRKQVMTKVSAKSGHESHLRLVKHELMRV